MCRKECANTSHYRYEIEALPCGFLRNRRRTFKKISQPSEVHKLQSANQGLAYLLCWCFTVFLYC